MPLENQAVGVASRRGAFPSTHWSIVLVAGGATTNESRGALESLCRHYWFPLYGFVRRTGRSHHEAEDLTQEFLARLLEGDGVARARPERGRFRTFLLTALRNFLTNEWHRGHSAKRGGGQPMFPLESDQADRRFAHEPVDPGLTPEAAFDCSWALSVIERALAALRSEYTAAGRGALFEAIAPVVWGGGAGEPLAAQAGRLGMNEGALKVAIHRLRKRLREHIEAEVAETVVTPAEVADEVRYLVASVARGGRIG